MTYRRTHRSRYVRSTSDTLRPSDSALACACAHSSSGMRMPRIVVFAMSVSVGCEVGLLDEHAAPLPRLDELPCDALGGGEALPVRGDGHGSPSRSVYEHTSASCMNTSTPKGTL